MKVNDPANPIQGSLAPAGIATNQEKSEKSEEKVTKKQRVQERKK